MHGSVSIGESDIPITGADTESGREFAKKILPVSGSRHPRRHFCSYLYRKVGASMDQISTKRNISEEFLSDYNKEGRQFVSELVITEGDLVVAHGSVHAANLSGDPVSWRETHIYRIADGTVKDHWPHVPHERAHALMTGTSSPLHPIPVSAKAKFIARAVGVLSRIIPATQVRSVSPVESNRALVASYVEQFKNQQKFQVFPKYFSHDFRHHFDFPNQTDTTASFVNVGVNLLAGFPDVRVELIHLIAEGDLVVEHNRVTATHRGTWANVEVTGRPVTWNEAHIYRVEKNRIVENWPAVNFDNLLLQITAPD
jgi:predicted ester cyclase